MNSLYFLAHYLEFNSNNPLHLEYVYAISNLKAAVHGIEQVRDRERVKAIVNLVKVEEFQPKVGVKIRQTDNEDESGDDVDERLIEELTQSLEENYEALKRSVCLRPLEFEKDDDTNFHMDFITACSNLRAENYDIEPTDKHNVIF